MAIADQIIGAESGGDATATNPNSSATGAGQFLASTWLDTLAKHRPDITGSPDELLAMRNDPKLSSEMTAAYAADNGAILKQAGLPVTPGTTYLAHFAGPGGAVKVLNADPATPAGAILGPDVVKANPFLAKMTAGDLSAWASRRVGGQPGAAQAQPQQAQAAPPPAAVPAPQQPFFAAGPAAPQQQAGPSPSFQAPAAPVLAPIFASPRKPVDLAKLRAAFPAQNFYAKG